jgi:hypothetical protein
MSTPVNQITQLLHESLLKADQSFSFRNDASFDKTLNLGQVIKGKVLRQYDGNHYSVNFNGQEKVVDSAVPLKTGELIYGRVVGLGDKVKLQRVFVDEKTGQQIQQQVNNQNRLDQLSAKERMLEQLFSRYQEKLSSLDRQIILKELNRVAQPDAMALSSLVLKKVGLVQEPEFLQAVFKNLVNDEKSRNTQHKAFLTIQTDPKSGSHESGNAVHILSELLSNLAETDNERIGFSQTGLSTSLNSENDTGKDHEGTEQKNSDFNQMMLGRRILNTQHEGSVDQWYTSIPLWINGKIVEINMALFNQHQSGAMDQYAVEHKKVVFSLEMDFLGKVEICVVCANRSLRADVTTDNDFAAEYMSKYIRDLKDSLQNIGWKVEEINYSVTENKLGSGVVRSVVEHHITNDSLNQLI